MRIIWLIGLCSKGNTPTALFPVLRIAGLPVLSTKRIGLSQDIILSLCFEGDIALATFFVVLSVVSFAQNEWIFHSQMAFFVFSQAQKSLFGYKTFSLSLMHQTTSVPWIVFISWHNLGLYFLYNCGYVLFKFFFSFFSVKPACLSLCIQCFFHYIYTYLPTNIWSRINYFILKVFCFFCCSMYPSRPHRTASLCDIVEITKKKKGYVIWLLNSILATVQ